MCRYEQRHIVNEVKHCGRRYLLPIREAGGKHIKTDCLQATSNLSFCYGVFLISVDLCNAVDRAYISICV